MEMNITRFNKTFEGKFRLHQYTKVTKNFRFFLEEWCPNLQAWHRRIPICSVVRTNSNDESDCVVPIFVLQNLEDTCVLVEKQDHGVNYFSGNSTEEVGLAILYILSQNQELYDYVQDVPVQPKHKPSDFEEQDLKDACVKMWNSYELALRNKRESESLKKQVKDALENKDIHLALNVLLSHDSGVEIHTLAKVSLQELQQEI